MIEKSKMTNNNNNNNDNKTDYDNDGINKTTTTTTTTTISTSPEEQKQFESKAVAKESAAVQKASKTFAELTSKISSIGEGQDDGAGEELKQTVRLLVMAENTDALTAVLTRLNGDRQAWETAQRQPVALIAMIIEEQQKRMTELQKKLQTQLTTTNNNNDNNNKK